MHRVLAAAAVLLVACTPPPKAAEPPHVVITPRKPEPPPMPGPTGLEPALPGLRLPKNFIATGYRVQLAIDPTAPKFDGSIVIDGDVSERSSVIWLHGRHLAVKRAVATQGDPFAKPAATAATFVVTPRADDLLELRAEPALEPGHWALTLDYSGEISDLETTGVFREQAANASYVFTQFEAIYARRAFPCIDEPDSKVPWQLTLDVPAGLVAVANTPVAHDSQLGGGKHRYEFAPTKPLPAYLVAFGVGAFEIVDGGRTKSGIPVRIVVPAGRRADAAFAAKSTARVLELLEDWFGTPYPYEKLDLLAVPLTVGFGAMENPGLVTFAAEYMLAEPQHVRAARKHGFIEGAAHELAHQWFGDYVTMAWWDDLWLNEGFATWLETKITARFDPAWHDELADLDRRDGALDADRLVTARRIRQPIEKADDISDGFDGITYSKGAAVLDMFEAYLGPDVFQRAVRAYLAGHAYGNATTADFVAALSAAAATDMAPAFATFVDQAGAPELTATAVCGKDAPRVELSQQRYLAPGSPPPPATKPWILPVCVAYDRGGVRAQACTLLAQPTGTIALDTKTCPRWILPSGRGYYRVRLTAPQAIALRDEAWPKLSWQERRAVFSAVEEAVRDGGGKKLPLQLALSFVPKLLAGGDRFTVNDAVGLPRGLDRLVADDQRNKYEYWSRQTFGPGATKLGITPLDTDDLDAETTRERLFAMAVRTGHDADLVKQAQDLAASWRDVPEAMRGSVLMVAVEASPELGAKLRHDVVAEPDRTRRGEMLAALARVRDPKRYEEVLPLLLDPALDLRESSSVLYMTVSEANRKIAENFYRTHKDELAKRTPEEQAKNAMWIFTAACDPARRDEIADYVTKNFAPMPLGARSAQQAIEAMDQCIATRKALEPEVKAWLSGVKIVKSKSSAKSRP